MGDGMGNPTTAIISDVALQGTLELEEEQS